MGMLIEEIIAKETEIAQEFQKIIDTHMVSEIMSLEEMCCDDTEVIEENLQKYKIFADYHNQIANTMRKYQQLQADYEQRLKENNELVNDLEELRTMINKFAESYENRLKADMVAMLEEIQLEIEEKYNEIPIDYSHPERIRAYTDILCLVQQKINSLKENIDGTNHT